MENSGRHVALWVASGAAALAAFGHEIVRAHQLYLAPEGRTSLGIAAAGVGAATALVVSKWRARRLFPDALPGRLLLTSSSVSLFLCVVPFLTFDKGQASVHVACAGIGIGVLVAALSAVEGWRAVGDTTLVRRFVEHAPRPLHLFGAVALIAIGTGLEARLGYLRSSLLIAAWLAVASASYPAICALVAGESAPAASKIPVLSCALVILAGFIAMVANRRLPLGELARYPDDVVFASEGIAHRYVVTAAPGGYELFSDGQLLVATLDARRVASALISPALAISPAKRVLLIGGGSGVVEDTLLRDPRVTELTVLTEDAELSRLATAVPFLAALGSGREPSPRVRQIVAEPLVWLAEHGGVFDAVIADLRAPIGYDAGKYYTRHFFWEVAGHLAPNGIAVIPATSAFLAGEAFASVVATVASAGLHAQAYHASIPTLGLASFVVGSREPRTDANEIRLALPNVLDEGRDLWRGGAEAHVATLHDQRVVAEFELSRETRGE